jgi:dTDP-4-dehydrorhamnose reductase
MPNPGPATTQTTNFLFNGDSTDGIQIAGAAADKLAFHGSDPVIQAAAITNLGNSASGTEIATAVNAILVAMRNKGLIAT